MRIGRKTSALLVVFGVWTWILWPNFLKNIWKDEKSWNDGPTAFFLVHLALTVVSFAAGNAIGWLGVKGLRATRRGDAGTAAGTSADTPAAQPAGGPGAARGEARDVATASAGPRG
ncbi:SCO4848 family membrane protein [Streptodolium elevatio]|uniref:Integral membrane protein n=1 Tax=Streptodolium elevatio TaxID=3157996 RepID=A0ABV3DQK0_9ACTN